MPQNSKKLQQSVNADVKTHGNKRPQNSVITFETHAQPRARSVNIAISVSLAILFVFLAGFNLWNMLVSHNSSKLGTALWIQIHRVAGYCFIALFIIFCYFMLLRVKGMPDELSPRLALHMELALALVPLLFAKVIVARHQKAARGLLTGLGIAIFTIAFTLFAMNLSIHYLRNASAHRVAPAISLIVIATALIFAVVGNFARAGRSKAKSEAGTALKQSLSQQTVPADDVLHLTLARVEAQTPDAKTLRFLLPRDRQISGRPGQFLTFEWPIDGKLVTRSYSICSSPLQTGHIEITVKRVENGYVSRFLNDHAEAGLIVKARGPFGRFCFDENQHKRIVLIAAGSGITPMNAMLHYIDDICLPVDVTLIYCVRTAQDVFFKNELAALQTRLRNFRYVPVLSQPDSDWTGWRGRVRREILDREVEMPLESTFFVCGPSAFMELTRTLLVDMSVEPSRILQESFGGAIAGEKQTTSTIGSFEIKFNRSATAYRIGLEGTLLESSEKNGMLIPSGCRRGNCGTCATKLLSGRVQMENEEALTHELRSEGFILPCTSRPLSDIVLDA
jgi:ferredoxin-NADP reductase